MNDNPLRRMPHITKYGLLPHRPGSRETLQYSNTAIQKSCSCIRIERGSDRRQPFGSAIPKVLDYVRELKEKCIEEPATLYKEEVTISNKQRRKQRNELKNKKILREISEKLLGCFL